MDSCQLETFLAVIEYRNYSRAAEVLNVTQPTVTARIKNLEYELNCQLFDREGKNVSLTNEGEVFVDYATSILTYMNHSKEAILSSEKTSIKIGFPPGVSYSFISNLLHSVQSLDYLNITIVEGKDSVSLNEQLLSGELDLVFTRNMVSHNPGLTSEFLLNDKFVLICGETHRLTNQNEINLKDLQDETMIWYRRGTEFLSNVEKQLIGIPNIKHIEVDNNEMLKNAVGSGMGIGITLLFGLEEKKKNNILVKNIKELEQLPNKIYVQYWNKLLTGNSVKKMIYSMMNHALSSYIKPY